MEPGHWSVRLREPGIQLVQVQFGSAPAPAWDATSVAAAVPEEGAAAIGRFR